VVCCYNVGIDFPYGIFGCLLVFSLKRKAQKQGLRDITTWKRKK